MRASLRAPGRVTVLALAVTLTACGEGAATGTATVPLVPAGTYVLHSVNGTAVPGASVLCQVWEPCFLASADTLYATADRRFTWLLTVQPAAGGEEMRMTETGEFRPGREGAALVYADREPPFPPSWPTGEARLVGAELELEVRPPWPSSQASRFRFHRVP